MAEYPTRKLETSVKLNELRHELYKGLWRAKEDGKILVQGILGSLDAIFAGIGEPVFTGLGANFGGIVRDPELLIKCHEAAEARDIKSDTCATMRISIGALYLGLHSISPSGERLKPDFCFDIMLCPHQPKANMVFADYYNVPYFTVETPRYGQPMPENYRRYFVNQMHDSIDWMEKIFGKKYDDEKLVEATITEWEVCVLWAKICELVKTIPAPIDANVLLQYSSLVLRVGKHSKVLKEILQMLLAEVEERVRDGIAILSTERCRLTHEGIAPFYYRDLDKFAARYGAVYIGGCRNVLCGLGAYSMKEDGSWEIARTPKERGIEIRTREDAVEALADFQLIYNPHLRWFHPVGVKDVVKVTDDWHSSGVIIHIDQGCRWVTAGAIDVRDTLRERGIPNLTYEANAYDPRRFNRAEFEDRLQTFIESLGLRPLDV